MPSKPRNVKSVKLPSARPVDDYWWYPSLSGACQPVWLRAHGQLGRRNKTLDFIIRDRQAKGFSRTTLNILSNVLSIVVPGWCKTRAEVLRVLNAGKVQALHKLHKPKDSCEAVLRHGLARHKLKVISYVCGVSIRRWCRDLNFRGRHLSRKIVATQKKPKSAVYTQKPRRLGIWVCGAEIQTSAVDIRAAVWVSTFGVVSAPALYKNPGPLP